MKVERKVEGRPWRQQDEGREASPADELAEESMRQSVELARQTCGAGQGLYTEFRRKVATGETVSAAAGKIAAALRFCGRITITFHQGKVTKTVLEESYFRGSGAS